MSNETTIERRILGPAYKDTMKALEQTNATLGMQDHFTRSVTHLAKQFGVQPRDLVVIGEFKNGELRSTFNGFKDPSPNPDEKGKLISFDEALQQEWKPAR